MSIKAKISIEIPNYHKPGKYFSLRLQPKLNREPVEFKRPRNLFIIAQPQNDFIGFFKLLIRKRIISNHFEWTFGTGHLVILGDLSTEDQTVESLWLIYSLEHQARLNGGYIHFLPGKLGKFSSAPIWINTHPHYAIRETSLRYPPTALYDGNQELWRWILTKNIVEKIGDSVVTTPDLLPFLCDTTNSLREINLKAQANRLDSRIGELPLPSDTTLKTFEIDNILNKFRASRLIIGGFDTVTSTVHLDGKVLSVGSKDPTRLNALLIVKRQIYYFNQEGKKQLLLHLKNYPNRFDKSFG